MSIPIPQINPIVPNISNEIVTVVFNPVRHCGVIGSTYLFKTERHQEGDRLFLPIKFLPAGLADAFVGEVEMPRWLAEDHNLQIKARHET